MNTKQLLLGLGGLSIALVIGLFVFGGSDEDVKIVHVGGPEAHEGGIDRGFAESQPAPLTLGGKSAERAAKADGRPGKAGDNGSRAGLDGYRQAHRPRLGGANPRHDTGAFDDTSGSGGPEVRDQVVANAPLAGEVRDAIRKGGGTARRPVDDWPVDAVDVVNPGDVREPEEGEVLTLFEGDPVNSQAEATIDESVTFEDDGAKFTSDSEYAVPMAGRLTGDAGTISFWVRPDGEASDIDNASLVQLRSQNEWTNRLQIWKDGANVRFVFSDSNGIESGATYGSDGWAPDEWRLVTATWGDGQNALYVNGQLAGTAQYEGGFKVLPNTLLHVGSNYRDDPRSLNGAVNQFRVYNRALNPDEVGALSSQYPE